MRIFALVGWAWLAMRELMGDTPVLDVTVLLVKLVSSVLNLLFALTYYTTNQFKHSAQAFLNHTACVWLLYIFCQLQSSTDGRGAICCVENSTKQSHLQGCLLWGLALHQPPAAITLAFLAIFLILASSQARVCISHEKVGQQGTSRENNDSDIASVIYWLNRLIRGFYIELTNPV
jgi:hypothetical protein